MKNNIMKKPIGLLFVLMLVLVQVGTAAATAASQQSANTEPGNETLGIILLDEGFEEGTMPPSGWTYINTQNPPYTWHIIDTSDTDVGVNSGNYAAKVNRYYVSSQDEKLITPQIDLTGYADITLEFWAASWTWNPGATVKVIVQGDGINDVIWDMIQDEVWETIEYRTVTLDLSMYTDETITICFRYIGIQGWHFGLDDIMVYAGEAPDPPEFEIGEITGGWAGFGNGGKVSAEIKNIGLGDATDVEWSISATGNGILQTINESDTGTILTIAPDDVETVELMVGQHFGRINVTVTAYEPHFDILISKSVNGFIFIGYVFILNR